MLLTRFQQLPNWSETRQKPLLPPTAPRQGRMLATWSTLLFPSQRRSTSMGVSSQLLCNSGGPSTDWHTKCQECSYPSHCNPFMVLQKWLGCCGSSAVRWSSHRDGLVYILLTCCGFFICHIATIPLLLLFLKNVYTWCGILTIFSLSPLNLWFHCLQVSIVLDTKSA